MINSLSTNHKNKAKPNCKNKNSVHLRLIRVDYFISNLNM